jgi:Tol biopolymer transport system component
VHFPFPDGALATSDVVRSPLRFVWISIGAASRLGDRGAHRTKPVSISRQTLPVAASRNDVRKRSSDLLTIDLRTGVQTKVTDDPWPDASVAWAPAGRRLAFTSLRAGTWTVLVRDTADGGREQPLGAFTDVDAWFQDGNHVICERANEQGMSLWTVPVGVRDAPAMIVDGAGAAAQARVPSDGRWLAYESDGNSRRREVRVIELARGVVWRPVSVSPGRSPRWRTDVRELSFLSGHTLMAVDVNGGKQVPFGTPQPLFDAPLPQHNSLADFPVQFAALPDGSRFLFAIPAETEPRLAIRIMPDPMIPAPR